MPIYGADGNTLTEGSTGVKFVNVATAGVLSENTSQVYAVKNPIAFICNTVTPNDWYTLTDIQNDQLWLDAIKNTLDPCPKGWRVPPSGTWNDFTTISAVYYIQGAPNTTGDNHHTNGRLYEKITWYSANGYRSCNTGHLSNSGNRGYYWTSTANSTGARYLNYNMTAVNCNTTSDRATGRSIRCVQE